MSHLFDDAEKSARKAYGYYEDGEISLALREIENALEINPTSMALHFNKALTLDALNRFEEAIDEWLLALEIDPENLEAMTSLGTDYTRVCRYDEAIDIFEQVEKLDSKYERCFCARISTYLEMGKHDMAKQMFFLAQQLKDDCGVCYYNIGVSAFAQRDFMQAAKCWLRTIEIEPSYPQINYCIARAYSHMGELQLAEQYFLEEIRKNGFNVEVLLDYGLLLFEMKDVESAKGIFKFATELEPDSAESFFCLAETILNEGNPEKAVKLYEKVLELNSQAAGPNFRLAQVALSKGYRGNAERYLKAELDNAAKDAAVLTAMGSMFLTLNEYDYAVHCLLRAVDADFALADAYYYLGIARAMKGVLTEAAEFFEHTLDINKEHFAALRDSALVYTAIGRFDAAAERLRLAKKIKDSPELSIIEKRIESERAKAWWMTKCPRLRRFLPKKELTFGIEPFTIGLYPVSGRNMNKPPNMIPLMIRKPQWRQF